MFVYPCSYCGDLYNNLTAEAVVEKG